VPVLAGTAATAATGDYNVCVVFFCVYSVPYVLGGTLCFCLAPAATLATRPPLMAEEVRQVGY